ncbi:MAG: tryptophan synthase subunit alpha [Melioribacteraceae bacterium]|nr:tryptophan synthase subunit alpha [Melioribacteraceae bacterium]MCF8354196.1 tryptophan synthase subunit alpha [Melioribacteraceae bacterium]MCF8392842.1 tryptophan synthase subunit alpha [Melioribacteraceae bacterium]MCF8418672.1 tryptophan synthase subunit alpha [Melioribacteraceae bacterium]
MSFIQNHIEKLNKNNRKALSIFLTAGFPNKAEFVDLACDVIDAGADMLEIGVPFGDSLADGPVIQSSFTESLNQNITLQNSLDFIKEIKSKKNIPVLLMSSSNPVYRFGLEKFAKAASDSGVDGLIIPDVPIEEYNDFFTDDLNRFDKILLTTPTSPEERINKIDELSTGFVYCVSVVGITGSRDKFSEDVIENIKRTYSLIKKNKMLIGFGISSGESIKRFSQFSDGVIVGSAVIKSLFNYNGEYNKTLELVGELSSACEN